MTPSDLYITEDGSYGICITNAAWNQIAEACLKSKEKETGGVLIGSYSADQSYAVISEVYMPTNSKSGRFWFNRGKSGLKKYLKECWNSISRKYYLGEWHYHPVFEVEPSSQDLEQMKVVSNNSRYACNTPIMLIAGKSSSKNIQLKGWVFPKGKVIEFKELF